MNNHYAVLGVAKDASQDDIKKQYRKLARKYHPDRSDEADAEAKFKEVNTAYQTLKDPKKRAEYDNPQPQFKEFSFRTDGGGQSIHDMLRQAMGGGRFQQQQQQPMAQVNISLEEAFTGTTRTLNTNAPSFPPASSWRTSGTSSASSRSICSGTTFLRRLTRVTRSRSIRMAPLKSVDT